MIVTNPQKLRQKSTPASISEAKTIYEQLLTEVTNHKALGLSAIQIGIPKRVFICWHENEKKEGEWDCYVNPRIISHESNIEYGTEGCLSFPGFEVNAPRYQQITVASDSFNDNYEQVVLYGLDAVVFQHELDHLEGVLFFDRGTITTNPLGTERNEPCFCGSGKKYKKCCGR